MKDGGDDAKWGYTYAVLMLVSVTLQSIFFNQCFRRVFLTGMHVKSALTASVYKKVKVINIFFIIYKKVKEFLCVILRTLVVDIYIERYRYGYGYGCGCGYACACACACACARARARARARVRVRVRVYVYVYVFFFIVGKIKQ